MKLEIESMLTVCTSHITVDDMQQLTDPESSSTIYVLDYEYGCMIRVPTKVNRKIFSVAFQNLIKFVRQHKCKWLRLDCDGDTIEGLQTFDWWNMQLKFGTPTEEELFKHHGILRDIMCSQNMGIWLAPEDVERLRNFILDLIAKRSKV